MYNSCSRRNWTSGFFFLIFLVLVTGTSFGQGDIVTLVIWGEPGPGCEDIENEWMFCMFSREISSGFSKRFPHIRLIFEEHGWDADLYNALQEAIDVGEAPDITIGETFLPNMVRDGQLMELSINNSVLENVVPATISYVKFDGAVYGVPLFTGVFAWEINADVFYRAGLIPEFEDLSTWESVLDVATRISATGNGNYYGVSLLGATQLPSAALFRVAPYVYQTGAVFCEMPECDNIRFDEPGAISAYEWFRELYQQAPSELVFAGSEGYIFSELFNGFTAMQTGGSWHVNWAAGSGCADCRYYPLPVPEGGERTNVIVGNAIYAGLANTEHPEEVQLFLEWLVSDEVQDQILFSGVGGRLPVTRTAHEKIVSIAAGDEDAFGIIPDYYFEDFDRDYDDAIELARSHLPFVDELLHSDIRTLPFWSVEVSVLWNEMLVEILVSEEPVEDIVARYQGILDGMN